MYSNFVIAGLGGSGTKYLATMLNKSQSWNVRHEGMRDSIKGWDVDHINKCLENKRNIENFGDVNGFVRCYLDKINCDKKAIILRDTKNILRGWYDHWQGWSKDEKTKQYANHRLYSCFVNTEWTIRKFYQYISDGMKVILFKKMISDVDYLNDIVKWCGIDDLVIKKEEMVKINPHYKKRINYNDIPERDRALWEKITEHFNQTYIND